MAETSVLTRAKDAILAQGNLPRHVAVIMDGNGRWARARGFPRILGHQAGRRSVRESVEGCLELGVRYLTLYTFSRENWNRPPSEVAGLMGFLRQTLREEREELRENGVAMRVIGRPEDLPEEVREELNRTVDYLGDNQKLVLSLALSYGGRMEIVDCVRRIAAEAEENGRWPQSIDEDLIRRHLYTNDLPDPDLLIRTSGEMRISNFLLWQLAYAEIWVTDVLWPDFRKEHLFQAIADYQKRDRRFGKVD
jgi:undecaprenyl diphosphate synthase